MAGPRGLSRVSIITHWSAKACDYYLLVLVYYTVASLTSQPKSMYKQNYPQINHLTTTIYWWVPQTMTVVKSLISQPK